MESTSSSSTPSEPSAPTPEQRSRARGCMLGQLAGDSLGSLVEFQHSDEIWARHPKGVRQLVDGGTWDLLAGQPTDDSELALMLARSLVKQGRFSSPEVFKAYRHWYTSSPFDVGFTTSSALTGSPRLESQSNGALMRVSPLGIFGAFEDSQQVGAWADADAALTHPNPVCRDASRLFAMALAWQIRHGATPDELYQRVCGWAQTLHVDQEVLRALQAASRQTPDDFQTQQGWVLIAFQNAFWQLLRTRNFEMGVVDTVMRGGDTDTNAAICGALLGAVYGEQGVPEQWRQAVLSCRPLAGTPGVHHPRPECFWPVDALELADQLLGPRPASVTG